MTDGTARKKRNETKRNEIFEWAADFRGRLNPVKKTPPGGRGRIPRGSRKIGSPENTIHKGQAGRLAGESRRKRLMTRVTHYTH